jgi:AAA15 family ATPase/GTPase
MGDNILKTKLLILTLLTNLLQADAGMSWVDQKIDEIKPARVGLNTGTLARLKSPFIVIKDESKVSNASPKPISTDINKDTPVKPDMDKAPLTLQIVLNSSALINGKWIKENEFIRGYKLSQIQSDYVVLERKSKKLKLFIAQKSKNLNISTK